MKTLILYLSVTGNTAKLAQEISKRMENSDLVSITLKTTIPTNHFWLNLKFGFLMTMTWGFRYLVPHIDVDNYDQVIIGTPVWIGRAAPPLIDVIHRYKLGQKINGAFVTYGGGVGNVFEDIEKRTAIRSIENKVALSEKMDCLDPEVQQKIAHFVESFERRRL